MSPTEDDMLRITTDIYPDSCKNPYNKDVNFEMDFSKKKPICVFRGSATGCGITSDTNMRLKAAELSHQWQEEGNMIFDAKLTGFNYKPKMYDGVLDEIDPKSFNFKIPKREKDKPPPNFMSLEEQSKHKYILNIDGHVKAFRLGNELRKGSVILLVDSDYKLWFQDKLKEDEHYILIAKDLSNLEEKINWCIEHEEKCTQIAKNALDFYNQYLSKEGTYNYFENLITDMSKLRKPPPKMSDNKLNIIAAYRDPGDGSRKEQFNIFTQQIHAIFKGRTDYHLYIIEQESERDDYEQLDDEIKQPNSKMAKFNLGLIKNIGYIIAKNDNKETNNPYYVLTDIDLVPSQNLIPDYLKFPDTPIHLGWLGTRYNKKGENKKFLGGVISFNSDDFEKCNGYPNHYWGWGGEDESLNYRLEQNKIKIQRSNYPVLDLEDLTPEEKKDDLRKRKNKEKFKWEKASEEKKNNNWKRSGLSNSKGLYRTTDRIDSKNMSHIKVHLRVEKKIYDLSSSETEAAGIGFDYIPKNKLFIGKNVRWFNKNDGELTGEILKIESKKATIKDNKGRRIKVLLTKLKEIIPPDLVNEREIYSEEEEEEEEEEKKIEVGSNVKWQRKIGGGFKEETGNVVKITDKLYQICCKSNGNNYFVKKSDKTISLIE